MGCGLPAVPPVSYYFRYQKWSLRDYSLIDHRMPWRLRWLELKLTVADLTTPSQAFFLLVGWSLGKLLSLWLLSVPAVLVPTCTAGQHLTTLNGRSWTCSEPALEPPGAGQERRAGPDPTSEPRRPRAHVGRLLLRPLRPPIRPATRPAGG
jgi:hypothetical protein